MLPKQFSKKVADIIGKNNLLFKQGAKEAAAYIAELQKDVRDAIVGAKGFELIHLKAIQNDLEQAGKNLQKKFTISIQANQAGAYSLGSNILLQGFKASGINLTLPKLPTTLLTTVKDYSADLIKNLTADAIEEISGYIRRGVITGQNPYNTMKAIENNVFREGEGLFGRAETIVRTENNRIFGLANQERMDQAGKILPGLKKTWLATIDDRSRASHVQAQDDYAPGGPIGPNPFDEPFVIDGEDINFPGDPDGDPHEVVNCRCVSVPFMDDWEKETEDLQEALKEGGEGSGNFGHSGRPGERGGSSSDGGGMSTEKFGELDPNEMHATLAKQYSAKTELNIVPKLPIVKLPDGTKFRPSARTNIETGEIEIDENTFLRTGDPEAVGYKVSGTIEMGGWQAIVCHETAHVIDLKHGVTTDPKFLAIHNQMDSVAKSKSGYVSEYAMNSPEENFAESFAVYKLNPTWLSENNPAMYKYIKAIK